MFRALHVAATGMSAQETHLEGVSNNIANANTVGFKKQRVEFQDLLYQTIRAPGAPTGPGTQAPSGLQFGTGVRVSGTVRSFTQGTVQNTGNALDVAVEGRGWLVISRPDGTQAFTRAGALRTDGEGRLVNDEGYPLDPPITIPPDATGVSIAHDGTVSVTTPADPTPVDVGKLSLAVFVNDAGLQALGHNLFAATAASGDPQIGDPGTDGRGTLLGGAVEQSNVDVVEEMIGLIAAQRGYEINSRVIAAADEMLRAATQLR